MKFYMTVGQRYRHESHPQGLHPDSYVVINADDEMRAREKAFKLFGSKWGFLYSEEFFKPQLHYYPNGELLNVP